MAGVTVRFVGTGDTVGSGGRFQTCLSLQTATTHILLDCGASSLIAMRQQGIDPATVDGVLVTHLHGDHFGGLPFLLLDAQFAHRTRPLVLAGPPGLAARLAQAQEVLFPGSAQTRRAFTVEVRELPARMPTAVGGGMVTAFAVDHPSGAPAYALRVGLGGRVLAYSGDTAWTEVLPEVARGADLFVCEAYCFDKEVKSHLSYATLRQHRDRFTCRRIILTHASADLLARRGEVDSAVAEVAHDGMELEV
ncbi:MAG: MBL fold metallo-hydrolase [Thermomicrobiales bacterium]